MKAINNNIPVSHFSPLLFTVYEISERCNRAGNEQSKKLVSLGHTVAAPQMVEANRHCRATQQEASTNTCICRRSAPKPMS